MKPFWKVLAVALCLSLAVGLVGCQPAPSNTQSNIDLDDVGEAFYVLLIGNDSRTGTVEANKAEYADGTGRSDTIMLMRIDPKNYQVTLVSIPRDTEATYKGEKVKINETYRLGGPQELIKQVGLLAGITADYYLDLGFVTFEDFINDINDITANVPIDMSLQDIVGGSTTALKAGTQKLDGAQALVLARFRKGYAADVMEGSRQNQNRQIVQVCIEKALNDPVNTALYIAAVVDNVKTDFPKSEMTDLVTRFVENKDKVKILAGTGPYEGTFRDDVGGLWLATRDEATWQRLMKVVDQGGDPTTVIALQVPRAA